MKKPALCCAHFDDILVLIRSGRKSVQVNTRRKKKVRLFIYISFITFFSIRLVLKLDPSEKLKLS